MNGGDTTTIMRSGSREDGIRKQLSTLSLNGDEERPIPEKQNKDPRKIARKYQIDLCNKALEENVVVYLETGCGKTHIAVLLIYEMGHLIKKPQKNICIFLAPTVPLVEQQAKVIESSLDFKVGVCCGSSTHLKSRYDWEKEIEEYEVLVMTPQIMLNNLSHCFIKIELISLLIFDECHYAQLDSNHPYAEIMRIFYKMDGSKLPRIFGMTASPKLGKGGSIDGLEALMRAKVYSVEDKDELERFVTSPKVNVYYYSSNKNGCSPHMIYTTNLEEIKNQSMLALRTNSVDQSSFINTKKTLQKLHCNIIFCLENLGLWGALQASYISLKGDISENTDLVEEESSCSDDNICNKYLHKAASFLASHCTGDGIGANLSCVEILKEPYFSRKLLRLIGILSSFRLQPDMKCIIFVNRIVTARSLTYILQNLKFLSSWKCGFLVGVHSGLVSRKNTNVILEKFRSGELNLLVATKVGEEGLDIQTCCLVIRFDLPETVASFIQSRGRARMPQSEYAFLVDSDNSREIDLIEHFKKDEAQMNEEISSRKSHLPVTDFVERTYKVDVTGATISSVSSVSLLHRYCSKLPHDEYFNPKPYFYYYDDADGTICNIVLPANAPIHQIVSAPQTSTEAAKKDACLKACKALHEVGALTDYLLPEQDDKNEESISDSDDINEEESRAVLYEMLVPAALRKTWTEEKNSTSFSSYYIKFCPNPADRIYQRFGLFVKEPLSEEAGKMKVDLCLARGRTVMTEIIPSGVVRLDKDEIAAAEKFQQMSLKIILDRHQFIPEYVSLENNDVYEPSSSTFYLLLPVIQLQHEKISVDWTLINRCLSSPIFRHPSIRLGNETYQMNNHVHLANGCKSVDDVVDSLVYVPCKDIFFFISDILPGKNGHSLYDDSESHVEHYAERFGIHLTHPNQPLLKAKQLFVLDNLLRKKKHSEEWREKKEHFIELPPEICQLKVSGFSKEIGSSLSLLPSILHRLENFLVAIELKDKLVAAFPEGAEVTADRILEALTTERCCEHFSLERLEVLGDAFLKFAVGRHLFLKHDAIDEGQLTRKRSNIVNNSNLLKLAIRKNLPVYIRDQSFEADQFFAFGRRCPSTCEKETEASIHSQSHGKKNDANAEVRCNRCHHWLHNKTIADVVEALTGVFIVDSGFKAATAFLNWLGIKVDVIQSQIDDMCSASKAFLPLSDQIDINTLESLTGHKFAHKGLLIQAFVHPSFNGHLGGCYQRLEFLGDAVLDYLITSYLYSVYPKLKPGQLTDLRSVSVNNTSFADVAARRSFHRFIICDSSVLRESMAKYVSNIERSAPIGHIEEKTCPKVLGDLVESCIGAIFLDTGFDLKHVWKIMLFLLDPIITSSKLHFNPIRDLHEFCQSYYWEVQFSSSKKDGKFLVEAKVDEGTVSATASATHVSGKVARKMAARQIYECLKAQGYKSKSKSLEEVLRKSVKKEAMLIGYDETPSYEIAKSSSESHVAEKPINSNGRKISSTAGHLNNGNEVDQQGIAGSQSNVSAKSCLYELCAANCWKPPVFECFKETGPEHIKEFVFRVVMEIEEMPNETFEFYGEPRARKKDAAEHAAEGALWYLKHEGYIWDKKRNN
ncbi:PREDICTED: dicer-like protein 4 isoform X2 [Erythranthe guttata]|uniref:dicer-like protein 4 isoform X2 n=1 Tax=Erythranthe guttata TaxID=4155 RepID=UPI00064D857B|nr:PREDICTED: dicer-like protein 4 isoform X2 [Erythranthe guttata]|eukprot:XP_012844161.1 PREDICTED: dicer-like protein 4 isoform X2 [Erythranthe guttata]